MAGSKKRRWFLVMVVLVVAGVISVGATRRGQGPAEEESGPEIPAMAARMGDVQVVVREVGTVEPEVQVEIKSTLSGRVVDLPIRAGDRVEKSDLIARIEPDVNQARNLFSVSQRVREARIDLDDAREDFEATQELYDKGLTALEVHRNARTRLKQAEQSVAAAQKDVNLVESSGIPVGDNPKQVVNITAPMAGVIIERPVELGETVTGSGSFNAGTPIATVADLGTMIVKAGINEVDIGKIHEDQPVQVTLDAFPRRLFPGTIQRIAPAARLDNQVKVFDVEIALDELGEELRTGMTANIEIEGERREDVLTVPLESVFVHGDEEVVYVQRDEPLPKEADAAADESAAGEDEAEADSDWRDDPRQEWRRWFEERKVVSGIASTTDVQIVEGLDDGETVALADPTRPRDEEERS